MTDQTMQQALPGMGRYDDNIHAGVTPNTKDKRRRVQFRFWMDANKPDESEWGRRLDEMKGRRKYSQFIRDAICLMLSLIAGNLDVLMELFPDIVEGLKTHTLTEAGYTAGQLDIQTAIIQQQQAEIETLRANLAQYQHSPESASFEAMLQDMAAGIHEHLEAVGVAVEQASTGAEPPKRGANSSVGQPAGLQPIGGQTIAMQPVTGGPTQLAAPQFAAPDFDDDDNIVLTVRKDESAGSVATANFLRSMMALQGS